MSSTTTVTSSMTSEDSGHKQADGAVDGERSAKRIKLDTEEEDTTTSQPMEVESSNLKDDKRASGNLPPSRALLGEPPNARDPDSPHFEEFDVGISEYISKGLPPIHAIIKQR